MHILPPTIPDQLGSLIEELPVKIGKLMAIYVRGLAPTSPGRVARTVFFEVVYRVRYSAPNVTGPGKYGAPLLWDGSLVGQPFERVFNAFLL